MYAKCPFCGELFGSLVNDLLSHIQVAHNLVVRAYNAHTGRITIGGEDKGINYDPCSLKVEFCEEEGAPR